MVLQIRAFNRKIASNSHLTMETALFMIAHYKKRMLCCCTIKVEAHCGNSKPSRVNKTLKVSNSFQEVINNHTKKFLYLHAHAAKCKAKCEKKQKRNETKRLCPKMIAGGISKTQQTRKQQKTNTKSLKIVINFWSESGTNFKKA
jgi:hypothetical protein